MPNKQELFTKKEVGRIFGCQFRAINRSIEDGKLCCIGTKITRHSIEALLGHPIGDESPGVVSKENEEITKLKENTKLKTARANDLEQEVRIKKANAELEGIVDKKAVEDFHKKKAAVEQTEVEQTKEWGAIQDAKVDLRDRRETIERQIGELKKWMPKFEAIKVWACEVSAIITNSDQWADKKLELPEDPAGSKEDTAQINRWLKKEEERKESQEEPPTQADSGMFAEESEEE